MMAAGEQKLIVDYIGHSGFLVETAQCLMLFDYYKGDLSMLDKKPAEKPLFIFASHAHADHFNPDIFRINRGCGQVTYLLAFDIKGDRRIPADAGVMYLDAGRRYDVPGLGTVETYLSNDEGVAFFVDADGNKLFTAQETESINEFSHGFNFLGLDLLAPPSQSPFSSMMWLIPVLCFITYVL